MQSGEAPTRLSALLGDLERLCTLGTAAEAREAETRRQRAPAERLRRLADAGFEFDVADDAELVAADRVEATVAVRAVRELLAGADPRPVVILGGGTGVGKTLAAGLAIAALGGAFVRAYDLGARSAPYAHELRYIDRLDPAGCGVACVLDELGGEANPRDARFADALLRLVNARSARRELRTVITTNLAAQDLRRYGPRIVDRLRRSARYVAVAGESRRRRA